MRKIMDNPKNFTRGPLKDHIAAEITKLKARADELELQKLNL